MNSLNMDTARIKMDPTPTILTWIFLIIGAGFSGVCLLYEAGTSFRGTWRCNVYPGLS